MKRFIFNVKWYFYLIGYILIIGLGCYYWYMNEISSYKIEDAGSTDLLRQQNLYHNSKKVVGTTKQNNQDHNGTIDEKMTLVTSEKENPKNLNTEVRKLSDTLTETIPDTSLKGRSDDKVAVSPYGFGPYPDIPVGMNFIPWEKLPANNELIQRVRIKLWEEGTRSDGGTMESGMVFPTVRGRVYLQGGNMFSHPDDNLKFIRGRIPDLTGFDVYSFDEAIEPYSYLKIER
ncbi:hypothetical protein JT359_18810 [Candidatus Poribacteria bacterium]|nr:hypothetical protein [Candidatus Poribacteria bacterium]